MTLVAAPRPDASAAVVPVTLGTEDDDGRPDAPRRFAGSLAWWRGQFANRLWPTVTLFFVLSSAATLTSSWGYYVGDNRFEQYFNPARRIAKSLTIWDGSRGMGRVREDFWPAATVPLALLRGIGASPTLAEHLFHAMCITMAGVGMVLVVRLFRPRIGIEHILAGLVMAFGAFSATFLLPSNLYYHYALAPWLFVVVFRGVHSDRPWRWAAMFALLAFSPGNVDTPGLVYNCVPLISVALFLVLVERSVRARDVVAWVGRALVLTVWVSAAILVKIMFAASALGQRLNDTESADTAALTSSWPESMRGLGNWLSYFGDGANLLKPQGEAYFNNWWVVAFTFVPPCVALFVLWQSRWRVRILYVMTMIFSLVVLVGAFPKGNGSPLGKQILYFYTNIKLLAAFRNTYKIGAGLVMGVAALFAYGVLLAYRSVRRRQPRLRFVPIILAFLTISVIAYPFWTGGLYDQTKRMQDLPDYWSQTFDYLAALPTDGRSLILPQTSRTRYRWGWVGDDLFDGLDSRNHALITGVPLSAPVAGNALEGVSLIASDPNYRPGVLAPVMRRLGLTEVVLRNDLDWQDMTRPRPSAFDAFRQDPDFVRVATFGAPGLNTTSASDRGSLAVEEKNLPPVEIYALKDANAPVSTIGPIAPLLIAGDGFSWASLGRTGLLNGDNPLAYTGELDNAKLKADLQAGSPVIITDSNRRRLRVLLSYEPDYSYLLGEVQDLDRSTQSLFKAPGSQSVAWFPSATEVDMSGSPRSLGGTQLWNRPANAFDGDPKTSWQIRRIDAPFQHQFHIALRQATDIKQVKVTLPPNTKPAGGITKGLFRFSDGTEETIDVSKGVVTEKSFERVHHTDSLEFVATDIAEAAQIVGIAEMSFPNASPGVDLNEFVQTPDDAIRLAATDPALATSMAKAPTGYVFSRSVQTTTATAPTTVFSGASSTDEEGTIRRRFAVLGQQSLDVTGLYRLRSDVDDETINSLIDRERSAVASGRRDGSIIGFGDQAIDGDPNTAWLAPAVSGENLTLNFRQQRVNSVTVRSPMGTDPIDKATRIRRVVIEIEVRDKNSPSGKQTIQIPDQIDLNKAAARVPDPVTKEPYKETRGLMTAEPGCEAVPTPANCELTATIPVPGLDFHTQLEIPEISSLRVRITDLDGQPNAYGKVGISEVQLNGETNGSLYDQSLPLPSCMPIGPSLDGGERLRLTLQGTYADLFAGKTLSFQACDRLVVGDRADGGVPTETWHLLDAGPNSPFDQIQMLSPDLTDLAARVAPTPGPDLTVKAQSSTQLTFSTTNATRGSILLFSQSFDPGWKAFVNGQAIGSPNDFNSMNGWVLDDTGHLDIELRYGPQRTYGYSLVVSIIGLAACIYLAVHTPRRVKRRRAGTGPPDDPGTR